MPAKLTTTINNIETVPNSDNAKIIGEFHNYLKGNDVSECHQNNCLKVVIALSKYLGPQTTFYDIKSKEQITAFLNTKVKSHLKSDINYLEGSSAEGSFGSILSTSSEVF